MKFIHLLSLLVAALVSCETLSAAVVPSLDGVGSVEFWDSPADFNATSPAEAFASEAAVDLRETIPTSVVASPAEPTAPDHLDLYSQPQHAGYSPRRCPKVIGGADFSDDLSLLQRSDRRNLE